MRKDIDFDQFKKILDVENTNIQQHIELEMKSLQSYSDSNPDLLDAATRSIIQGRRIEWIDQLKERQIQIQEAVKRLETGQFGICAFCGTDIEVDRLKIKPYAKYCIKCREKEEQRSH
jgi:DnaK suppressor protein